LIVNLKTTGYAMFLSAAIMASQSNIPKQVLAELQNTQCEKNLSIPLSICFCSSILGESE
jgi:hypothetical protein